MHLIFLLSVAPTSCHCEKSLQSEIVDSKGKKLLMSGLEPIFADTITIYLSKFLINLILFDLQRQFWMCRILKQCPFRERDRNILLFHIPAIIIIIIQIPP